MLPGALDAVAAGCRCSPSDNHQGRGTWRDGRTFSISTACRLHWPAVPAAMPATPVDNGQLALFNP